MGFAKSSGVKKLKIDFTWREKICAREWEGGM